MAINFTDNPANGATQVVGGRTYTYNSAKNKWDTTATEVTGPTATVYATVDDLPTSGNITGAQAYVSGNNRLYIWNGTGWYNIALINTAPSISGVSSSYILAADGTATTVTITATDPEGLPITYSIASDTSGSIATVAQGTGSNTNVFTITPSTDSANAGTFSLTFRASDGVNIATAVSEFTLEFIVENSNYTSLLLTTDGSTGGNTTFTDSSSNSHTITPAGPPRQSTFSPYRSGGYSTYFDGSGDYVEMAAHSSLALDTSNFTVEFWYKHVANVSTMRFLGNNYQNSTWGSGRWTMGIVNGKLMFQSYSLHGTGSNTLSTVNIDDGSWHHCSLTRTGSTFTLRVDGTDPVTYTNSGSIDGNNLYGFTVGARGNGAEAINGYISDFRLVKGTAVYTADFTAPEERLTAVTNTSLLTCHLPYIADGSTNGHTITPNGNVATIPFAPYDYQEEYTVGTHGGSAYFYGTSDWLSLPTAAGNLGTGDFTVELWVYHDDTTLGNQTYIDTRHSAAGTNGWILYVLGGQEHIRFYANGGIVLSPTSAVVRKNAWNHVALSRSSGTLRLFVNGVVHGAQTGNTSDYAAHNFNIGAKTYTSSGAIPVKGNISDVRISTNARYTANFTPPTTAFTNDSNTQLLVSMQDAAIIDKSQTTRRAILVGNTTASTAQYKYLPSSIYFDGTDDGIRIPMASGVGATERLPGSFEANEDFTIEMWHYLTARTELYPCLFSNYDTTASSTLALFAGRNNYDTDQYQVRVDSTTNAINAGTINYNQWVHVALVRSSGTITLYIDGTSVGTTSSSAALLGNGNWMGIGFSQSSSTTTSIQGYLSDVRITRGLARYTANFTPPTAALKG